MPRVSASPLLLFLSSVGALSQAGTLPNATILTHPASAVNFKVIGCLAETAPMKAIVEELSGTNAPTRNQVVNKTRRDDAWTYIYDTLGTYGLDTVEYQSFRASVVDGPAVRGPRAL